MDTEALSWQYSSKFINGYEIHAYKWSAILSLNSAWSSSCTLQSHLESLAVGFYQAGIVKTFENLPLGLLTVYPYPYCIALILNIY